MRESEVDLQVSKNVSGIRVSLAGGRKRDDPWWLDWSKVWQRLEVEICNWVLVKCHALPMFGCGCPQNQGPVADRLRHPAQASRRELLFAPPQPNHTVPKVPSARVKDLKASP